jgi:hypothetical protein
VTGRKNAKIIVTTLLHVVIVCGGLLLVYWVFPDHLSADEGWVWRLTVGLVGTLGLLAWQVQAIQRANRPLRRAIQALAASIMTFIVVFSLTYLGLDNYEPQSFTEHLDKVDSFYYTVTTLGTVGYGDIAPVTHTARIIASVQMLLDLVLIGALVRVLFHTASGVLDRRKTGTR